MRTSVAGRKFIERWEGLYLHAYDDRTERIVPADGVCVGVLTIGYGHTTAAGSPAVCAGMTCTETQADEWLSADLGRVERQVSTLVKVPLTQVQFDVLVSFEFNTGGLANSTLLRKLNAGDYGAVPIELLRWVHDGGEVVAGLVNRRKAEAALWKGSAAGAIVTAGGAIATGTVLAAADVPGWEIGLGLLVFAAVVSAVLWWRSRNA